MARIFPTSIAATGIQTHVISVASLLGDLNPRRFTDLATAAEAKNGQTWYLTQLNLTLSYGPGCCLNSMYVTALPPIA